MTVKILDVGSSGTEDNVSDIEAVFSGAGDIEIIRLDIRKDAKPDIIHDITRPLPKRYLEQYDVVFASHVLEHIDRNKALDTIKNIAAALKVGGEFYFIAPSLEWAAAEIYFGRMNVAVQTVIYGGQTHKNDYHRVGYTLDWMRFLVENVLQMPIRKAYQAPFTIKVDDDSFMALQNIVIGLKVEIVEPDASDAIG